jgi:hypothetical protein
VGVRTVNKLIPESNGTIHDQFATNDTARPSPVSDTDTCPLIPRHSAIGSSNYLNLTDAAAPRAEHFRLRERKVRGLAQITRWFESTDDTALSSPPRIPHVQVGDLFVHHAIGEQSQIWLWDATESNWLNVTVGHPHPSLFNYRLSIKASGEPRWVTRKTASTYKGRGKKAKLGVYPNCLIWIFRFTQHRDFTQQLPRNE